MKPFSKLRAFALLASFAFALTSFSYAILDLNSNGLSDLWEKQHNNGTLFGTSFVSTADPDQDGWDNATEAVAGTDPFEPNPPDGIVVTQLEPSQTHGAYTLTWPTIIGKRYRLQASYELDTWFSVGNSHFATASSLSIGISAVQPDTSVPPKLFWRIIVGDVDDDNDLLTNAEEYQLGTNPTSIDSDGDTLNDLAEILATTNPLDNDTDEDGIHDNLDATPLVNNAIADPDGANLPASLNAYTGTGAQLIARYDFQNVILGSTGGFPSSIPGQAHATATNIGWDIFSNPSGMPSFTCQFNTTPPANEFLSLPTSIVHARDKHVWSYWLKLPAGAFNETSGIRSLLSFGNGLVYSGSTQLVSTALPHLHWYVDLATDQIKLESYFIQANVGIPIALGTGWTIPPEWNDGKWHHIALHQNETKYTFYFDGASKGQRTTNNISSSLTGSNAYLLIGRRDLTPSTLFDTTKRFWPGARLDRLRVYKTLSAAEILTLYNQDIDNDGLFDRTEARHRMWRDLNNDNTRNANESYYVLRPFHHDAVGTDHDKDGITSHDEQNIMAPSTTVYSDPANFDTDGDLLPDGWEKARGMHYAVPGALSNKDLDPDGDGLTNYKEYLKGTEHNDPDTDDDGVDDGDESDAGSNPKDPSDEGQAPDPAETYSLTLGVGDESGSDSEHYEMVIYTYNWETNSEIEYTRVAPDTYGDYIVGNMAGFDPLKTYTFQIRWKGTKLDTYNGKGPDYDYTFKVEPVTSQDLVTVTEVFNPETATIEVGNILGKKNDVHDFTYSTETKRVVAEGTVADFAMDYDMDGNIETLKIVINSKFGFEKRGPDASKQDRELFDSDPLRHCIIDVNNNNTDFGGSGGTTSEVDNSNDQLDSEQDREEMLNSTQGHSFGKLRLWLNPHINFGIPWKNGTSQYSLRLSLVNPEQSQHVIRVFNWQPYDKKQSKPEMLLGPGKTSHTLNPGEFFDEVTFKDGSYDNPQKWFHNFCVEGITYGVATIKFEILNSYDGDAVVLTRTARVGVNVDQFAQPQSKVPTTKEALAIRGENPHYVGIRELPVGGTVGFVRALKGRIICRVPSFQDNGGTNAERNAQLTTMRQYALRANGEAGDAGQSFWIGLREDLGSGQQTWAQCGLRWQQMLGEKVAAKPTAYAETGTFLTGSQIVSIKGQASPDSGSGVDNLQVIGAQPLQGWETAPLMLDFIMWKSFVSTTEGGGDSTPQNSWKVIFKDARPGKGALVAQHYFVLSANAPTPQVQNSQVLDAYRDAYANQKLNILDANLESSLTCAFAVGNSTEKGSITAIQWSNSLQSNITASSQPADGSRVALWTWLNESLSWENVDVPSDKVKQIIRTGRNTNQPADGEIGEKPHPFWKMTPHDDGFEIWDLRNFGFGQQDAH